MKLSGDGQEDHKRWMESQLILKDGVDPAIFGRIANVTAILLTLTYTDATNTW